MPRPHPPAPPFASVERRSRELQSLLGSVPVIPVVTVRTPGKAAALARTLVDAGLPIIEITLRTPNALAAIEAAAASVPEAIVGAGTVTSRGQLSAAAQAGARFAVSPGLTWDLVQAAAASELPFLPGAATVSEAMVAREAGFRMLKLFPAQVAGGVDWLRAVAGPLPDLSFCPTGGINGSNFATYLERPNVVTVGGSWMCPESLIDADAWTEIGRRSNDIHVRLQRPDLEEPES